jgi:hypothetical protein
MPASSHISGVAGSALAQDVSQIEQFALEMRDKDKKRGTAAKSVN